MHFLVEAEVRHVKVIIPVAGIGTRLRPHTHTAPKPLLHVAGKPILGHILDAIAPLNPEQVIFVVGHMGEKIIDYVKGNYDYDTLFIEQAEPLGLGYAIFLALEQSGDTDVLVLLGDTIIDARLADFVSAGPNVLGLKSVDMKEASRFGIAVVENDRIIEVVEKPTNPPSALAIVGAYYFSDVEGLRTELKYLIEHDITTKGEYQITDALKRMIDHGSIMTSFEIEHWYDCGKKETLLETNRALLAHSPHTVGSEGVVIIPPVYIAPDATVRNAIIGPFVSIGPEATVSDCIVRDSIISARAQVSEVLLEGSLVGNGTQIKGHFKKFNVGDDSEVSDL
jgi:glucose-1-phosphate thymidylyltransferase